MQRRCSVILWLYEMSSDSGLGLRIAVPLKPHLIALLSHWIIFLGTHLPAASRTTSPDSRIRLLGTWFPLVSKETVVITKATVWQWDIWGLSHPSSSDIITLSFSEVVLLCSLVMLLIIGTPSLSANSLTPPSLCVCVCCCRSCSWNMPARRLHKRTTTKVAPSLPWTSATSWPPSDTTCWLRL